MSIVYQPGRYKGVVAAQAMSETKTGNTQFVLTIDLLGFCDPSQPDSLTRVPPGQRSVFRVITDKTIDYVLEDLKYLGYDKPTFGPLDPSHPQHHSFKGQEVDLICAHEEYNEQMQEKWSLSRGGGLNLKPLDNAALRKLDALYGAKLKANAAPTSKSAPTRQKANTEAETVPPEDGNSIPF